MGPLRGNWVEMTSSGWGPHGGFNGNLRRDARTCPFSPPYEDSQPEGNRLQGRKRILTSPWDPELELLAARNVRK